MTNVGYLSHLPWLFPFLKITPILNAEHRKFWKWCTKQVAERRRVSQALAVFPYSNLDQMKPDRPDVFSWVLEDYESTIETKETICNLEGDAYLIVVAGRYDPTHA